MQPVLTTVPKVGGMSRKASFSSLSHAPKSTLPGSTPIEMCDDDDPDNVDENDDDNDDDVDDVDDTDDDDDDSDIVDDNDDGDDDDDDGDDSGLMCGSLCL